VADLRVRTTQWRIDRVRVVIAEEAIYEFMIYHDDKTDWLLMS